MTNADILALLSYTPRLPNDKAVTTSPCAFLSPVLIEEFRLQKFMEYGMMDDAVTSECQTRSSDKHARYHTSSVSEPNLTSDLMTLSTCA
ncbi:hypothetical protein Baya_4110 [Bagarius yarrelli]|uniref:Uncharacterized protein n=1 Tax=Bagarius yarrelli TaxID=175774 RepID=A0A556TVG9_BAGYA|nr:hypothetical protein Baya_4110 [Bagarius yarrelli]